MAEWQHKEASWSLKDLGSEIDNHGDMRHLGFEAEPPFTKWLDEQCLDGWEVLKISRDFTCLRGSTWVLFRKQL